MKNAYHHQSGRAQIGIRKKFLIRLDLMKEKEKNQELLKNS
jgi:hypothetical protein